MPDLAPDNRDSGANATVMERASSAVIGEAAYTAVTAPLKQTIADMVDEMRK